MPQILPTEYIEIASFSLRITENNSWSHLCVWYASCVFQSVIFLLPIAKRPHEDFWSCRRTNTSFLRCSQDMTSACLRAYRSTNCVLACVRLHLPLDSIGFWTLKLRSEQMQYTRLVCLLLLRCLPCYDTKNTPNVTRTDNRRAGGVGR